MKNFAITILLLISLNHISAQTSFEALDSTMVLVIGTKFEMGRNDGKKIAKPVHSVQLADFYIGKYEVTQTIWNLVMGSDTLSSSDCMNCPVINVKPENIDIFITQLNLLTGKKYRIPTEAEWEYAAIGGVKSKGYLYSGSNNLDEVAWNVLNSDQKTHEVGLKKPNELGLYDMSGNVWEICSDWYMKKYYKISPNIAPIQTKKTLFRVSRGGSWRSGEERCQSRARNRDVKDHHISNSGFRLVLEK
jgi:formylglycine-generating enzyme required for sulfatase activity